MKSLESQYRKLNQNGINIEWNNAAKYNNIAKIKFMLEQDYINITDSNMNSLLFRISYNDDTKYVKTLKYLLKHCETHNKTINQAEWNLFLSSVCINDNLSVFNTVLKHNKSKNISFDEDQWEVMLNNSCLSNGDKVLNQIFKIHDFTYEQLSKEFVSTIKNLSAFEAFSSKLDVAKEVEKNSFLQKVIADQCLEIVTVLINTYQIDFTFFKEFALENVSKPKGDKIFELIETQELYLKIDAAMPNKTIPIKMKKI